MKILALVWIVVVAIYALLATVLKWEPASTLIDMSASSDGSFFIIIPFGLTWIIGVIPLFFIMMINNLIRNKKNRMPADLSGKTGILIQREKELQNAALPYQVLINGVTAKKVGMGKKVFLELAPGKYTLQTKTGKWQSAVIDVELYPGKILAYSTKTDFSKSLTMLVPKGETIFLVQIPFNPANRN